MAKQTRLERYFTPSKPAISTNHGLISLPSKVLLQIYLYVLSGSSLQDSAYHVHLNYDSTGPQLIHRTKVCEVDEDEYLEDEYLVYEEYNRLSPLASLALTCRRFNEDITKLVYSQYHFKIFRDGRGGLNALFNLRTITIANLRSLTIVLRQESTYCGPDSQYLCFQGQSCWRDQCDELVPNRGGRALGHVSRHDRSTLEEWRSICALLRKAMLPNRLHLCLICDVRDVSTAREVIEPMYQLPTLAGCSIRLSPIYAPELEALSAEAVSRLTRGSTVQSFKQLPSLPYDIQVRIMGFTDLVTTHDLSWIPQYGFIGHARGLYPIDPRDSEESDPYVLRHDPCPLCIGTHETCHRLLDYPRQTSSSMCACWQMPHSLFRLSHRLRHEAMRIFFSKNHFYIDCRREDTSHNGGKHSRPRSLLEVIPREAIRFLRSVQLLFINLDSTSPMDTTIRARNIDQLSAHANLPRLTLTINETCPYIFDENLNACRPNDLFTTYILEGFLAQHCRVLAKNGLRAFYIHLHGPSYDARTIPPFCQLENDMERLVMGKRYDINSSSKYDVQGRWPSPWSPWSTYTHSQ